MAWAFSSKSEGSPTWAQGTKNTTDWITQSQSGEDFLLQETEDYLLLENQGHILLEQHTPTQWSELTKH